MKVLYLTVLENTEKNSIHENQIFSLVSTDVIYKFLFISPLFILNRSGFKFNSNKNERKDCIEIKIPLLSFNFYLYIALIPFLFLLSFPFVVYYISSFKPEIVHCRNLLSSLVAVCVRKIFKFNYSIISDPRSVYPEEGVIIKRWKNDCWNYRKWKKIEAWTFKNADACIGLSELFTNYLSIFNEKSYYIPAVVSESFKFDNTLRAMKRTELSINDNDVVLIYVGSIGLWHDVGLFLQILENASKVISQNLKIIVLNNSKKIKLELKQHFPKECIFCDGVPPQDVIPFLAVADFGILPGSLNYGEEYELLYKTMIASKAEEYLCSGLPVIVNDRIINLKKYVEMFDCGIIYDTKTQNFKESQIRVYSSEERMRISIEASDVFGLEKVKDKLSMLYMQLTK